MGASVSKELDDLSSDELASILETYGAAFANYRETLVTNGVNGGAVSLLSNDEDFESALDDLGITSVMHRKRLLFEWKTWKSVSLSRQLPPRSPSSTHKPTSYRTPAKKALRSLSVSEHASPNEAIGQIAMHFQSLSMRYRYTTQDESTIGQRIQRDNSENQKNYFDLSTFLLHNQKLTVDKEMLDPDPNSNSAGEDLFINEPFSRIISAVPCTSLSVKFSGQHSNLIDDEGREQRVDLSLFNSEYQEWATLVTVIEGKQDLKTSNYNCALGQCMRRATAILSAQPWRDFVIVPFHCLQHIAFLKVEWIGNRDFGWPDPVHSGKFDCLDVGSRDVVVGDGFHALYAMLENPALFGYLPCPVRILTNLGNLGLRSADPICVRSEQKALFVVNMAGNDDTTECVLKVFKNRSTAECEFANVMQLAAVDGTIKLKFESVVTIQCEWGNERGDFFRVRNLEIGNGNMEQGKRNKV